MSSPFVTFSQLPFFLDFFTPKPVNDPTNKHCIIISTQYRENRAAPGIYKYNIHTNESEIIYTYDNTFKPSQHGQFIDPSNNTLILYGGQNHIFGVFDLNTNQMKEINNKNILCECNHCPQNTFIPSPINQIHTIVMGGCECNHYQFNIITKQTIKMKTTSELRSHHISDPKFEYIKSLKKLYLFGGNWVNKIFSYNNNKWNISKLTMPHKVITCAYDTLNAFEDILLLFYFEKKEIFILDLLLLKWYISKYSLPQDFEKVEWNCYVMKIDNNVCIIDFQHNIHVQTNIYDIIPREIVKLHQAKFKPLVMRYLNEKEKELSLKQICTDLKILILKYFPLF